MAHERYKMISTERPDVLKQDGFDEIETFDTSLFESLEEYSPGCADEIIEELISIFMEEAPHGLENLKNAVCEKDLQKTEMAAHTLKGSCATIGVARTAALCGSLEQRAFHGSLDDAEILVWEVEIELKRALKVLESVLVV